ncbi:MAG: phosphatidate cytidylyltransferase [Muribaculaceae bacterium]|nr:phosphatidate cytidylyltransferase [Muribaculaceae bacterium]
MKSANPVITRALSGVVYVAVIVCACILGEYGVMALGLLFSILSVVEYKNMYASHAKTSKWIIAYDVVAVASLVIPVAGWLLAILLYIGRMIIMIYDKGTDNVNAFRDDMMMYLYLGIPIASMVSLGYLSGVPGMLVLAIFIMIWLNDTGAYCVGSLIGRHKMFPRVSPKKSWEGFIGGMMFCVAFGVILGVTTWPLGSIRVHERLFFWITASVVICITSTFGDLFESCLKRNLNIKDSGHLIPGHGGILDRIDSMLLVMPAMLILLLLWTL